MAKDDKVCIQLTATDMVHLVDVEKNLDDLKRMTYDLIDQMKDDTYVTISEKKITSVWGDAVVRNKK